MQSRVKPPESEQAIEQKQELSQKYQEALNAIEVGSIYKPETLILDYLQQQYRALEQYDESSHFNTQPAHLAATALETLAVLDPARTEQIRTIFIEKHPQILKPILAPKLSEPTFAEKVTNLRTLKV